MADPDQYSEAPIGGWKHSRDHALHARLDILLIEVISITKTGSVLKSILEGRGRPTDLVSSTNPFRPHSH